MPKPMPPSRAGGNESLPRVQIGGLADSQDAVKAALDNPPPGGWVLPGSELRGKQGAHGSGGVGASEGTGSSCGDKRGDDGGGEGVGGGDRDGSAAGSR